MKNAIALFAFLFLSQILFAQNTISDDDLKKYAVLMDSVDDMKSKLADEISTMVANSGKISNSRYNELSRIAGDEAKLAEAKATSEEISFIKKVEARKEEGIARITTTFQKMAQDYVGAAAYNKISKALTSDEALKTRYTTMRDEIDEKEN
jgi:hypothetical protein